MRVVDGGVELVDLAAAPGGVKRASVKTGVVRAVFDLGSSFGVLTEQHLLLFDAGKDQPQSSPGVTWLPGARVFPDLVTRAHLLVLHAPNHVIYRYAMTSDGGKLLPIQAYHDLSDYDGRAFVALRDGSFLYSSGGSFTHLYASGRRTKLAAPHTNVAPLRALRARRIDQVFVLYEDGLVERLQVQDRMRVVWTERLGQVPFDVAASKDDLVLLEDVPGEHRSWRLRAIGPKRREPLVVELGNSEEQGGDWVARLHQELGLATSKGRVAVNGPWGLGVWKLSTGERLLAPP